MEKKMLDPHALHRNEVTNEVEGLNHADTKND